jgi:hypothetical protein
MYSLRLYHDDGLVKITLVAAIPEEQLQALSRDLERTVLAGDRPIRSVLVDQTRAELLGSELPGLLTSLLVQLLQGTEVNIAQLVASELVAHQLDRVAESLQTDDRLRHFWDSGSALAWLSASRPPGPKR